MRRKFKSNPRTARCAPRTRRVRVGDVLFCKSIGFLKYCGRGKWAKVR
jgi:hypothetical protein